ncbi:MAG TPA: hypothetical protein VFE60_22045 [Roseiarcus sp.]|jgi:hypothetical protein|nr:hypothetical protein [Roseiarcus sp.]
MSRHRNKRARRASQLIRHQKTRERRIMKARLRRKNPVAAIAAKANGGVVRTPDPVRRGELAIFAPGQEAVDFVAEAETEFMLGSAVPHPYELVTGYYSVHTRSCGRIWVG